MLQNFGILLCANDHIDIMRWHKIFPNTHYGSKNLKLKFSTTTKGKRSDEIPPDGNDNSLLEKDKDVSEHPPFARYRFGLEETLELAILPFPLLFTTSVFISEIFLTFFS